MEYTVQRGDTLYTIAQKFSISMLALYNANREILDAAGYRCENFPKVLTIPSRNDDMLLVSYDELQGYAYEL